MLDGGVGSGTEDHGGFVETEAENRHKGSVEGAVAHYVDEHLGPAGLQYLNP